MSGKPNPVVIEMPGYDFPGPSAEPDEEQAGGGMLQPSYKIPPFFWMFLALVAGYLGLRYIMED